jgi:putative tryptophan/tyrosine transport system substrate-binding protein
MLRRSFLAFLGTSAAWPHAGFGQRATLPFIGYLSSGGPNDRRHLVEAFRQGLKEVGYVDGKDVAIEYRWAEGRYDRLPALAKELAQRQVTVLVATGGVAPALAARAATTTIPIVFTGGVDPVQAGLVKSLSRPGGNATGVVNIAAALAPKRFQILRDLVPSAAKIAYLLNPQSPNPQYVKEVQALASASRTELKVFQAVNEEEIDAALAAAKKAGAQGLVVHTDAVFVTKRDRIVALAARYSIPTIYPFREFVLDGGLISYGADLRDIQRQAGAYAGRILKGAKPADLPVLQASKFEMLLNLKTAKKLGVTVSRDFFARVDEVIQ